MKKVFVGLSGGVDSAVSAALLKEAGYDVTGAFIKIWQPEFIECTWREDRLDAMRVAAALGIPFKEIDLSVDYEREVVQTMIADYARGVTPNPDVLCNRSIKFGSFAKWAFAQGADYVATGHYARIQDGKLLRGEDIGKDQSYFLYQLNKTDLARTLFPVGELEKKQVRALARRFNLPNQDKPDSQGLCFIGDVTMKEFLARFITLKQGDVVDSKGAVIGTHDGAALYTIGQRHGFSTNVSAIHYVVGIDAATNVVHVSENRDDAMRDTVELKEIHWVSGPSKEPFDADVQTRYRETPVRARIEVGKHVRAVFEKPHLVSSGQSLVMYRGEECIGGGVIQ